MNLDAVQVGARTELRIVEPNAAMAFGILQACGTGKGRAVERQVAVTGHAIEKGGVGESGMK